MKTEAPRAATRPTLARRAILPALLLLAPALACGGGRNSGSSSSYESNTTTNSSSLASNSRSSNSNAAASSRRANSSAPFGLSNAGNTRAASETTEESYIRRSEPEVDELGLTPARRRRYDDLMRRMQAAQRVGEQIMARGNIGDNLGALDQYLYTVQQLDAEFKREFPDLASGRGAAAPRGGGRYDSGEACRRAQESYRDCMRSAEQAAGFSTAAALRATCQQFLTNCR